MTSVPHLRRSDHLIRPPLQRRSQESLERVLAAGFELLKEEGFEGFTLQAVSKRADVSIGSIYARVPSREALFMALEHPEDIGHPDPELAIDVAFRLMYCTIARRITHGPHFESPRDVSDQELVAELSRAVADYLL
jgi:tetracycline repressor-like protein